MNFAQYVREIGGPLVIVCDKGVFAICPAKTGGALEYPKDRKHAVAMLIAAGYVQQPNHQWTKTS